MTDKRILVAAHKKYGAPSSKLYLPIQVGANGKECIGFVRDDSGYNISDLKLLRAYRGILGLEKSRLRIYRTCALSQVFQGRRKIRRNRQK